MRSLCLVTFVLFFFSFSTAQSTTTTPAKECTSNSDCTSTSNITMYCAKTTCDATAKGVCKAEEQICPNFVTDPPMCGCDGKSYGNPCFAARAGVNIDTTGNSCPSLGVGKACSPCAALNLTCPTGLSCCACGTIMSTCQQTCPLACTLSFCSGCESLTEKGCTGLKDRSGSACAWCPSNTNSLLSTVAASGTCVDSSVSKCPAPSTEQTCDTCLQNKDCPDGSTCCGCGRNGTCKASCGVRCMIAVICDIDRCASVSCPAGSACVDGICVSSCRGKCATSDMPATATGCDAPVCVPGISLAQSNNLISTTLTCQWKTSCPPPPVCVLSGCGQCVSSNNLVATVSSAIASCVTADSTVNQRSCALLRAQACQPNGNGGCAFTDTGLKAYNDCVSNVPPPRPICKGISNPCTCDYASGCIYVTAHPLDRATSGTTIAACLPPAAADQLVRYISASSDNSTAAVTSISVLPPVCLTNNVRTDVAAAVAGNTAVTKIMQDGFDSNVAAAALGAALSQISNSNIKANAYVIVAFGVPVPSAGGVTLTVLVDVYGSTTLDQNALDILCPAIRKALAASSSIDDAQLVGCDLTVVGSDAGTAKRWIGQTSDDTTHLQMTSTLPGSSSDASVVVGALLAYVSLVALFLY